MQTSPTKSLQLEHDVSFGTTDSFHTAASRDAEETVDTEDLSKEIEQLRLFNRDSKRVSMIATPVVHTSPLQLPNSTQRRNPDSAISTPGVDTIREVEDSDMTDSVADATLQNDPSDTNNTMSSIQQNNNTTVTPGLGILIPDEADKTKESTIDYSRHINSDTQSATGIISLTSGESISLSHLFIVANHSFDPKTLHNKDDAAICLSFSKGDIAFVHVVDESGWGEVTLLNNHERGWVPFNYFQDTVVPTMAEYPSIAYLNSRQPLEELLSAAAKFLSLPTDNRVFDFQPFNEIRDGVKDLLEATHCVSRSDKLVKEVPIIRKSRKALLADWYDVMIKADHYKHKQTSSEQNRKLVKLTHKVINRAFHFYNVWSAEISTDTKHTLQSVTTTNIKQPVARSTNSDRKLKNKSSSQSSVVDSTSSLLTAPPHAITRLTEIHNLIFQYIALILGRLQMVTNNPSGYETLESIIHQIIIILRELLYISKTCSYVVQQKFEQINDSPFDKDLDQLLSLVSDMVSTIKVLVTMSLSNSKSVEDNNIIESQQTKLLTIVASMTPLINNTVIQCNNYLRLIGDFQLDSSRTYTDFTKVKIHPKFFIAKSQATFNEKNFATDFEKKTVDLFTTDEKKYKRVTRFSTITPLKEDFFNESSLLSESGSPEKKSFARDSVFLKYKPTDEGNLPAGSSELNEDDLVYNDQQQIISATARGLVYKLSDEMDHPSSFFVSTFLLNFRTFMKPYDLVTELINRFELEITNSSYSRNKTNGNFSNLASKLKNRRRLICSIFNEWMESYWIFESDYDCLPTMINFFNEGISELLPRESKMLIQTAAALILKNNELKKPKTNNSPYPQIIEASILKPNDSSIISEISTITTTTNKAILTLDERLIEEYELTHIPHQSGDDFGLPIPVLNLGTFSLISKQNMEQIQDLVFQYRTHIGSEKQDNDGDKDTEEILRDWSLLQNKNIIIKDISSAMEFSLIILNPLEVAKQLTLLESALYLKVKPFELVNYKQEKLSSPGETDNIKNITNFTNQLSQYVMNGMLSLHINDTTRTTILKAWLRIALSALYLRNFNSVASIMTALQNHSITRISNVWDNLPRKDLLLYEYLSRIIHPNNNYKVYRQKLKKIIDDSIQGTMVPIKCPVPVVPFFNLFLQDITFIREGNSTFKDPDSFRPNKPINIDKFFRLTKTITTLQYFQTSYNTEGNSVGTKRESFFRLTLEMGLDTKDIAPVPLLQELIVYELWKVNDSFTNVSDRAYQLSLKIQPR
ncbi:Bud site selection protein 5 [Nakaseomyces bracarensis]|uniref:Bud site selection protein 5 n=1 Tax=Nakaseomyces bracarensis TaxID=273131 RepID=A0ABR4NYM5_9SACH